MLSFGLDLGFFEHHCPSLFQMGFFLFLEPFPVDLGLLESGNLSL